MADKKKVYSIVINGLQESVDMAKSLNEQLKELDRSISKIQDRTIKIKGEVEVKTPTDAKTVVSGGSNTTSNEKDSEKELAIQKQITAEIRAQAQAEATKDERWREAYKNQLASKQTIKETRQELEAMASGAAIVTEEGLQYTNTMKGMKAELKALKQERDQLDLAKPEEVERFKEIQQRALELETLLKSIESEAGVFSRNVGNYPQLLKQTTTEWENVQKIITTITDKLSKETPGTAAYDKLKSELEQAEKYAKKLDERLYDIKSNLNQVNSNGLSINVGGVERQFNSVKDAVKTLTRELQEMTLAGKQNTEEFKATITALGQVKTAVSNTSSEIKSYVGNAKALNDTIEIMQGVSSIASIGTGIQGLFGNTQLDDSLKKFASLTMIMQGLEKMQKSMTDKTSIWGVTLASIWNGMDKGLNKLGEISGISSFISKNFKTWSVDFYNVGKEITNAESEFEELLETTRTENSEVAKIAENLIEAEKNAAKLRAEIAAGKNTPENQSSLDLETSNITAARKELKELADTGNETAKKFLDIDSAFADGINKTLSLFVKSGKNAVQEFLNMGKGAKAMAVGMNLATTAVKTFAKATIILAAVQIGLELITATIDKLSAGLKYLANNVASWFGSVGAAAQQTQVSVDSMNTSIEMSNDRLEKYNKEVERLQKAGSITAIEAMSLKLRNVGKEAENSGLELQQFIKTVDNLDKSLGNNLNSIGSWYEKWFTSGEKGIDGFLKRWETLRKAVEAGTDEIAQGGDGWGWWYTASDAVDDFSDANKAMLQDLSNSIQKIDFSKPEKAVKDFDKLFEGEIGNARDYAYRNIDKLFPEEPWAQMLKARLDATKSFLDQYRDMMAETGDMTAEMHKEAAKQIRDNTTAALPQSQREAQQLKDQRADEIESMKKHGYAIEDQRKLEASINAKYDRMEKDRRDSMLKSIGKSGDDEYNILKQIRDNLLNLQSDGLDKEIKKLENAMADELHAAEKATKHRGELILSIQKKYQKLIEDKRTEWYKNLKKQQEQWNKEWVKMMQESADEVAEIMNTAALNSINRGLDQNENLNIKRTANISYDTSIDTSTMSFADNDKNIKLQKEYYDKLIQQQKEYIAEKTRLQLEESNENERILKEQAEKEYNQRTSANKEWYEAQIEAQNKAAKDGLVTEEEYQNNLLTITNSYQNANADAYEVYQTKLNETAKNGEQERNTIVTNGRQEEQRINDEANQKAIASIQDYYNEIADIAEREQKQNMNRHTGLFDYGKEKERLEKVKAGYDKTIADLETEYEKLKQQLNDNEIDFSQFQAGKKQIEDLKKQAQKASQETSESLSDLFQTWAGSVNDFASKIGQELQSLYSTFNDIQNLKLDAEQQQLDAEQDMLDKQSDMVEKAYNKQSDIVQRYKDAINNTEDELKNARGERRLALLDSLAAQREGYLAETEALKRQELEKEKIAKKEEQLKKKQDELEKKRKKQQQQASIVNATINTALGVTQALAAWPPPASYALAAAVGALGATEIALIASQKYAKGGLLEGKDHAHGGIKVPVKGGIAEVEGNEYIVNKQTTTQNLSLMEFVNSKKRRLNLDDFIEFYSGKAKYSKAGSSMRFADGGTMPELTDFSDYQTSQPVVVDLTIDSKVSTVDIINSIDRVTQTRVLAGLD